MSYSLIYGLVFIFLPPFLDPPTISHLSIFFSFLSTSNELKTHSTSLFLLSPFYYPNILLYKLFYYWIVNITPFIITPPIILNILTNEKLTLNIPFLLTSTLITSLTTLSTFILQKELQLQIVLAFPILITLFFITHPYFNLLLLLIHLTLFYILTNLKHKKLL